MEPVLQVIEDHCENVALSARPGSPRYPGSPEGPLWPTGKSCGPPPPLGLRRPSATLDAVNAPGAISLGRALSVERVQEPLGSLNSDDLE